MRHARDDLGQTIVIAGLLLTMILGIVGLGVDIGWFELNLVRIQRAEDYYGIARLCPNTGGCSDVLSASGSGTLASQGFWGSVLAKGADRQNGDAYSTYYNLAPALNTGFDANGYSYIVDFPAGTVGGSVWIFDPIFCAVGRSTSTGAWLGTGDYSYNGGGTPITTEFKLWDMNGTPYSTADDTLIASDAGLFANMNYV